MAAPVYTAVIAGTDRAASNVLLQGFSIREVTNGVDTAVLHVESEDASLRPVKRQEVVITEDGIPIMGGVIRSARESAFGGISADGHDHIVTEIEIDDFSQYFQRRFITLSFAGGSLASFAVAFTAFFSAAPFSITLDGAQATGPTLPAIEFEDERGDDALNFVAALTAKSGPPFQWKIDPAKVWGFYQAGADPAPWNVIEANFQSEPDKSTFGDITAEPTDDTYANKIIVIGGSGKVVTTTDSFVGTGVDATFGPLKYKLVGPIPPPVTVSPPTQSAVGFAVVWLGTPYASPSESLGVTGTANVDWWFEPSTGLITRQLGPLGNGVPLTIEYNGQVKFRVVALDAGEIAANGLWEDKIVDEDLEDPVLALEAAEAELARRLVQGKIVKFESRRVPGPKPGQSITLTVPKRNTSGSFTVVDVITEYEEGSDVLKRVVTCTSSVYEHWRQTLTRWWSPNLAGGPGIAPAASGAAPGLPVYSAQWNNFGTFGGAYNILYGPLFWDQPDQFLGEEKNNGWIFVANSGGHAGAQGPGGLGPAGHLSLTEPYRLEMGILGSGDFSMDLFSESFTGSPGIAYPSSILLNAPGSIYLTSATGIGSEPESPGQIGINGYGRNGTPGYSGPLPQVLYDINYRPEGVAIHPGDVGESFTRMEGLTILEGLVGFYQTVSSLPYTVHTTAVSDQNEFLAFIVSAGTGTINLPNTTNTGGTGATNLRVFPETLCGRMFFFKNIHASGTVTLDPFGTELIDGASTLTLPPGAGVLIIRYDTSGWKVLLTTGGVTLGGGGGGSAATPGGANLDVQFNDSSTFGGENAFTYDKTKDQLTLTRTATDSQLRIKTSGSDTGIVSFYAQDNYADIRFGWEEVSGVSTSRRTGNAGYFWWQDTNTSPNFDGIGAELSIGETAGSPMAFAQGRGFAMRENGRFDVYQYGGLGTGSVSGPGVYVQHNDSGSGNAAYLALEDLNGIARYIWFDATGAPRTSTAPPQEDGTPSDTSGTLLTASGVTVITALAADPGSPSNGDVWVRAAGTTPTRNLELRIRDGGVSYTIASITV